MSCRPIRADRDQSETATIESSKLSRYQFASEERFGQCKSTKGLQHCKNTPIHSLVRWACILLLSIAFLSGCSESDQRTKVTLWHQMTVGERVVLDDCISQFESQHPNIQVNTVYKETEELRSGFQAAALAGTGPELVFGPSDSLGTFMTMQIVQDMAPWFEPELQAEFRTGSLTFLDDARGKRSLVQIGDRVGNHLALVYNRNLIAEPPKTTDEMVAMAVAQTQDTPAGKRYGLVWNFVEPFFMVPFLTGYGGWVFEEGSTEPALDTPQCAAALQFVADLQNKHKVLPANCDYEDADSLFKTGQAAMIINGDWSWSQYLENKEIDAVVATLPIVSSTGIPMGPMVATKGYSLNVHANKDAAQAVMKLVRFMTSRDIQKTFTARLKTLPSNESLWDDDVIKNDPTLVTSAQQLANGKTMPVNPELRAIWDGMRPPYQELLGGSATASAAAASMQKLASEKMVAMNRRTEKTAMGTVLQCIGLMLLISLVVSQRSNFVKLAADLKTKPFAYFLIFPAMLVIALTIVYPFIYNIILSFSNMSLRNFQDWEITGFQNYAQVFSEWRFFEVLVKTLIWTVVCVFFHLAIGLLLAWCLNGPVRGKSIYRLVLILPWAIPAYITALTWRGMFNYEYGAINLMLTQWFGLQDGVNWLGDENLAFLSCIITNVWLGFPFMMVIALGGMQGIPAELYEAARMDRITRWKQFWHITLPMLRPVLLPATTLGAIWTFNNLNVVWLVTNAGEPADKTHILVSYVYKAVFNLYQYGYGAALSMIIFFLLLIFSLTFLHRTNATEGVSG